VKSVANHTLIIIILHQYYSIVLVPVILSTKLEQRYILIFGLSLSGAPQNNIKPIGIKTWCRRIKPKFISCL